MAFSLDPGALPGWPSGPAGGAAGRPSPPPRGTLDRTMLTATDRSTAPVRRVRILTAGGTIAMVGDHAQPELDADDLVASVPGLQAFPDLEAITILNKPSAHLTLEDQLRVCRAARDASRRGIGVVVTHGTDVLEETAMLCDVLHDADAPI